MDKFSIIIPVKVINDYVRETVSYIQAFKHNNWELIILPNASDLKEWVDSRIQVVPSGGVGPAQKRDMGAKIAVGNILVFLDDDSYPDHSLLTIAEKYFASPDVVALGGPAVTPPQNSFWQKVSGAVFLSRFSGCTPERYVPIGNVRPVNDWPSVNLMVRTDTFLEVGGFDSCYWPGEDTKFCLDLIQKTGKKILYIPEMQVWHHRRTGLFSHLKQVGGYGLHRGYFAKHYPETSRKLVYFIPSAFVIFIAITIASMIFMPEFLGITSIGWVAYALALCKAWFDMQKYESTIVATIAIGYTFFTHIWYGVRFMQGLLTTNLVSRIR